MSFFLSSFFFLLFLFLLILFRPQECANAVFVACIREDLLSGVAGAKETRLYYVKGPKEAPKDPNAWETEVVYIF